MESKPDTQPNQDTDGEMVLTKGMNEEEKKKEQEDNDYLKPNWDE